MTTAPLTIADRAELLTLTRQYINELVDVAVATPGSAQARVNLSNALNFLDTITRNYNP